MTITLTFGDCVTLAGILAAILGTAYRLGRQDKQLAWLGQAIAKLVPHDSVPPPPMPPPVANGKKRG